MTTVVAIIPTYNEPADAIERTVRALLDQTSPLKQIIVVDDASPTPAVLHADHTNDPRVKLVRLSENHGVANARNTAAADTDSDYLLFVNIDVVLHPDWVQEALEFMREHPNAGMVSGRIVPRVGTPQMIAWRMHYIEPKVNRTATEPTKVEWLVGHVFFLPRSVFCATGGFDPEMWLRGEDYAFCRQVAAAGYDLYHLPDLVADSYEPTTVQAMAYKSVRNAGWDVRGLDRPAADVRPFTFGAATRSVLGVSAGRAARSLARRRMRLAPIELMITISSLALVHDRRRLSKH